jgi:hypothetical protein
MAHASALSLEEFSSLARVGCGTLLAVPIPNAHALKLTALRYIEVVGDHYEVTVTGQFRIASGS